MASTFSMTVGLTAVKLQMFGSKACQVCTPLGWSSSSDSNIIVHISKMKISLFCFLKKAGFTQRISQLMKRLTFVIICTCNLKPHTSKLLRALSCVLIISCIKEGLRTISIV